MAFCLITGGGLTFKTTLKGTAKFVQTLVGDLWVPFVSLLLLAVTLGFGIAKLVKLGTVINAVTISVVWLVFAGIPPFLVCFYAFVGQGAALRYVAKVCFVLAFIAPIIAIVLLWFVYPTVVSILPCCLSHMHVWAASAQTLLLVCYC